MISAVRDDDGDPDLAAVLEGVPLALLVLSPDLIVQYANRAYLDSVARRREALLGRGLWELFPPAGEHDQQAVVQHSLERVRETGEPDSCTVRYDLRDEVTGELAERYWQMGHAAVRDAHGHTTLLVQWSQDVSSTVREQGLRHAAQELSDSWRQQAEAATEQAQAVTADLQMRGRQLSAEQSRGDQLAEQVARLSSVALLLGSVDSLDELEQLAVGSGLSVLGADDGALITLAGGGAWRVSVPATLGERAQATYGELPHDSPLPGAWTARTGDRVLLPTRASGLAFDPGMADVYALTHRAGWAFLPLRVRGRRLGALAVA